MTVKKQYLRSNDGKFVFHKFYFRYDIFIFVWIVGNVATQLFYILRLERTSKPNE